MACEQGSVYYCSEIGQWVAVDSYCVVCGNEVETRKLSKESDALRYAAVRRMLEVPPTVHNMPKVLSELSGSVCIKYQLIVEDVPSLRQWGKGIEKEISVINENNQNWFTEKEPEMLSDALLCLINCIKCMKPMAASMDNTQIVDDHIKSIQQLHYKICTYMEDK